MKLTPKEAYDRMMKGEECIGSGMFYRIKGPVLELQVGGCVGDAPLDDPWSRSAQSPLEMLRMEWSTVYEPDINAAKLDHENDPSAHTIDCYPRAHVDELEKRIKELEGLVRFGKFVLKHGHGYFNQPGGEDLKCK